MCTEDDPNCESDEAKRKQFLQNTLILVTKIDQKVDFEKYDGKPARYEFTELMYEILEEGTKIYVQVDLELNKIEAQDSMLPLFMGA